MYCRRSHQRDDKPMPLGLRVRPAPNRRLGQSARHQRRRTEVAPTRAGQRRHASDGCVEWPAFDRRALSTSSTLRPLAWTMMQWKLRQAPSVRCRALSMRRPPLPARNGPARESLSSGYFLQDSPRFADASPRSLRLRCLDLRPQRIAVRTTTSMPPNSIAYATTSRVSSIRLSLQGARAQAEPSDPVPHFLVMSLDCEPPAPSCQVAGDKHDQHRRDA